MNTKKPKDKKIIIVIIIAIIYTLLPVITICGIVVFESMLEKTSYQEQDDGSIKISNKDMIIKNDIVHYYNSENETYYVEGYFVNNTNKKVDYITIIYNLYDINNVILGQATATMENINANETWKFKATYTEIDAKNVVKIRISDVQCENF